MHLKELKLKNFKNFSEITIEFNEKITRFMGINGSGKSSILEAIWAAFNGIAERGKSGQLIGNRYNFIKTGAKSSNIQLTISDTANKRDITVVNNITKTGNSIKVQGCSDDEFKQIMNSTFLSAKNFCSLSSKEQAIELGIDCSEYDSKMLGLKEGFTLINAKLRAIGELTTVDKVETVNVDELLEIRNVERQRINELNANISKKNKESALDYQNKRDVLRKEIEDFNNLQMRNKEAIKLCSAALRVLTEHGCDSIDTAAFVLSLPKACEQRYLSEINNIEAPIPVEPILETEALGKIELEIDNASKTNALAEEYKRYKKQYTDQQNYKKQIEVNKQKQKELLEDKVDYIQHFNFGFEGLDVNESGELLLSGRHIKPHCFSRTELELIVARLHMAKNDKMSFRFIDDFESWDKANQEKVINELLKSGFQVITAEVGEKSSYDDTVYIKEGVLVDSYDDDSEKYEQQSLL